MENWLGQNIVVNGEDASRAFGNAGWLRLGGELYYATSEIDSYVPGQRNGYELEQITVEFDGSVAETRTIGSGLTTDDNPALAFAFGFASGVYKIVTSTETAAGYEIRTANATGPTAVPGATSVVLGDSVLDNSIDALGFTSAFNSYYAILGVSPGSPGMLEASFQAFNPTTNAPVTPSPIEIGSFDEDAAGYFGVWNSTRIVSLAEVKDTVEGNADVSLSTQQIDGTSNAGDRNYVIDLDRADIDKIRQYYAEGQIGSADMLFVALDNDIAAATPKSRISLTFVEDTGTSGVIIDDFSFDVDGAESDFHMTSVTDPSSGKAIYFMTFIDGGDLKAITFNAATQQFSDRFTVETGVAVEDFSGITSYADGRFVVNWYGDNALGGRDLLGQVVDVRGPGQIVTVGTESNDLIAGSTASETLSGKGGNDGLAGGLGNDRLEGDAGNDMLSGGAGADVLIGGTSSGQTGTAGAQVYRIYQATLDRAPDTGGFEGWVDRLESGASTVQDVVGGFVRSGEFQNTYGSLDNTDFVTLLYNNVLDRAPDQGGLNAWLNQLSNGATRESVVTGFSESGEFKGNTSFAASAYADAQDSRAQSAVMDDVFRLYQATLDRAPDPAGLDSWSGQLAEGVAFTTIARGFTRSAEFTNTYGTLEDNAFINQLYRNVLDREADAGGLAGWQAVIDDGGTREDVVRGFAQGREFIDKTAADFEAYMKAGGGDTLNGGAGNDTLYGRATADTFVFDADEDGANTVLQLDTWDTLQFRDFGYATAADALAKMSVAGSDIRFDDQGVRITFADADLATVQEADYLFA